MSRIIGSRISRRRRDGMKMNHNNNNNINAWLMMTILLATIVCLPSSSLAVVESFVIRPNKINTRMMIHSSSSTYTTTNTRNKNNNDQQIHLFSSSSSSSESSNNSGYKPPEAQSISKPKREAPYPKIGDIVRYYDIDGGDAQGQVLVGKISLIQTVYKAEENDDEKEWLVEITELEDVGDGYYAEYPSRKRKSKQTLRNLRYIAPLAASFVRGEDAYKVPRDMSVSPPIPKVMYEAYKVEGYEGPMSVPVNEVVVKEDYEKYGQLKLDLIKNAALAGLAGTIIADLTRGLEDAIIYGAGAAAGVGYLYFLSIKTDTVGSADAKLGNGISNIRFVLPALVLVGVALRNVSLGEANPVAVVDGGSGVGFMSTVTKEQFASAMLGFLTYRLPLFGSQLSPVLKESAGSLLPGSAGVALQMAEKAKQQQGGGSASSSPFQEDLVPVLLVCGPSGTGKTSLIQRLIQDDEKQRFILPKFVDKVEEGANFELLEKKEDFLQIDDGGRFGLTKEGILNAAAASTSSTISFLESDKEEKEEASTTTSPQQVVVVDANVDLAKKLVSTLKGARLVGVWIGLDSLEKFESRLNIQLENKSLIIPNDETKESFMRGKIREIVNDIEYGVVSGIFEFTILNDDFEESLAKLKEAAEYCFK